MSLFTRSFINCSVLLNIMKILTFAVVAILTIVSVSGLSDTEMAALLADDANEEVLLNIELQQMDPGFKYMLYTMVTEDTSFLTEVRQQFNSYLATMHTEGEPRITDRELDLILNNELTLAEVTAIVYS